MLPGHIQDILFSFDFDKDLYKEAKRVKKNLAKKGWFVNYDLSGTLYDLKPTSINGDCSLAGAMLKTGSPIGGRNLAFCRWGKIPRKPKKPKKKFKSY